MKLFKNEIFKTYLWFTQLIAMIIIFNELYKLIRYFDGEIQLEKPFYNWLKMIIAVIYLFGWLFIYNKKIFNSNED